MVITLLCTAAASDPTTLAIVQEVAADRNAEVQHVTEEGLLSEIVGAQARGAVVVLVGSDQHASRALGFGADEVVRVEQARRVTLAGAIARATIRGHARERRVHEGALQRDDAWATFSLLVGGLGHHLATPLMTATANTEVLRTEIAALLQSYSELSEWAALAMPLDEMRKLASKRAEAMSFEEIRSVVDDIHASLRRITGLAEDLRSFARGGTGEGVHVGTLLREIETFLRDHLSERVEFVVEVADSRPVALARPTLVCLLGALLSQAVTMAERPDRVRPRVRIRTAEHDDVVDVEIEHDGLELMAADLLDLPSRGSLGLAGVRRRAIEAGGELLTDTDGKSTRYRLLLPASKLDGVVKDPALSVALRKDDRPAS
ncbi:MAG TPA: hypothetical protein VGG39_37430 [Polyangiaceae bacterium]